MSLNKSLCLSSDSQNRDSFSERICDDLCEVILQYLPLKDKLRLECVSKQFQRTIFQKPIRLKFSAYFPKIKGRTESRLLKNNSFDLKSLEALLKKCPNITSIEFTCFECQRISINYSEFIALITKHCNNLIEFKCPLNQINDNTFNELHQKLGSNLKVFKHSFDNKELSRLTNFPNVEELELYLRNPQIYYTISGLNFKRVKRLKVKALHSFEGIQIQLKDVMDKFKPVRYLHLEIPGEFTLNLPGLDFTLNLNDLIEFKSVLNITDEKVFIETFKQLANNSPKLKRIEFTFRVIWENVLEFRRLFTPFKAFKHLKRLNLKFINFNENGEDYTGTFSFEAFEGFSNLTHLSLIFNLLFGTPLLIESVDQNVFDNIEKFLPNLQYLHIYLTIAATEEGTAQMADNLSRLSRLEFIELYVSHDLTAKLTQELIRKCKKIRTIHIRDSQEIRA